MDKISVTITVKDRLSMNLKDIDLRIRIQLLPIYMGEWIDNRTYCAIHGLTFVFMDFENWCKTKLPGRTLRVSFY
jgi:hypothetical protein